MEIDKEFWMEFINIYKLNECLWNKNIEAYVNRSMRDAAYNKLIEKCKKRYPTANKDFVTRKIHSLRCSFRRELKKVQLSKRSGSSANNVYIPTLWYYNSLKFITDCEISRERRESTQVSFSDNEIKHEPVENDIKDEVRIDFYI